MPLGINSNDLLRYFRQPGSGFGKSIQRSWGFDVSFIYNPLKGLSLGRGLEFPPIIQPFYVLDVTMPTYSFKKEVMMYGQVPRTFPILEFEGFDVDVTLEEDEKGTVDYFINWNQRNIIDDEGYYSAPDDAKIKAMVVEIYDNQSKPVVYYIFHDLYFLAANPAQYSYNSNDSIKRTVTFGVDRVSTYYIKQNVISQGIGQLKGLSSLISNRG